MTSDSLKIRSKSWYLLPIFFHIIGGIISFFAIRNDDPKKAKRCLILGGILFGANILVGVALMDNLSKPDNIFAQISNESQIELQVDENSVEIELNESAKFLTFRWDPIVIPIENIEEVHQNLPQQTSSDIRNPGTYVPEVVKAGTFYTQGGEKEFWFTQKGKNNILTIEIKNHEFDRIVLESEKSKSWIESLNQEIKQK